MCHGSFQTLKTVELSQTSKVKQELTNEVRDETGDYNKKPGKRQTGGKGMN